MVTASPGSCALPDQCRSSCPGQLHAPSPLRQSGAAPSQPALSASQPLIKTTRGAFPSPSLLSKGQPWPWHRLLAAAPQFLGYWQGSPREYPREGEGRARRGDNTGGRALKKLLEPLCAFPWFVSPSTLPPCLCYSLLSGTCSHVPMS